MSISSLFYRGKFMAIPIPITQNSNYRVRHGVKTWQKWLEPIHYTKALQEYFEQQQHVFESIVASENYTTVIEAGCGDGSFLFPTAVQMGINYYGVDKEPQAIAQLNKKISHISHQSKLEAVCADMHDFVEILADYDIPLTDCLVVFPFNALGVMENPRHILSQISRLGLDTLIFTYKTTDQAQILRRDYYCQLGFANLVRQQDTDGIAFRSEDGLLSYTYYSYMIDHWLQASSTATIQTMEFSQLGIAIHANHKVNNKNWCT